MLATWGGRNGAEGGGITTMELREVTYFLTIADEGYLTRAAEKLHVTQPTLSQFLTKLEREIGAPLFYRRNMIGLELTPVGQLYYNGARRIDEIWQSTLQGIEKYRSGTLSVIRCGTSGAANFTRTLMICQSRLQERCPGTILQTLSASMAEIQHRLLNGGLDIGYSAFLPIENRLTYLPLETSEVDLVVPPSHPLAALSYQKADGTEKRYPLSVAASLPFALIYEDSVLRMVEEVYFHKNGFRPNIATVYSYPSSLKECMLHGDYAGFCPRYQHFDSMARIALSPPMYYTLGIYYRSDITLKEPVRHLIDLLREMPFDYDL